jgi:hypothetical protein
MHDENGAQMEGILKSDKSCISNPEIRNLKLNCDDLEVLVQFKISDFGI